MSRAVRVACVLAGVALAGLPAHSAELRVACYSDGNECEATEALSARFMADNPAIRVVIDKVPYKAILESLPVQLAAGQGPDVARVTDFGPIMKYFLDLRPYLHDPAYWEANFGPVLPWMRADATDQGIYGLPTQLTVTAPIVNTTLFEQAGEKLPGPGASWDDWAAAASRVAGATGVASGMAWDRSGHRFAGAAISMGARYFAADGTPSVVDDGYRAMASRWLRWNNDGHTVDRDVWVASGGGYRDAFEEFANGRIVVYLSGSWQLRRLESQIGDAFDWAVVPNPCGPAACSGMPGGAAFVAFRQTQHPQEVARWLDWLASAPVYAEWMSRTANIPAHAALQKGGVAYQLTPSGQAAMAAFVANAGSLSPVAYRLQGYRLARSVFNPTVDRLSQAIAGQITLDQAYARITADVADALAAAKR